ncbi:MAG: DUF927 domain-containing protein, partial [Nitrosomonadales bacterium]|nr:DUF927 domain-containing protein [Nitrosomonadales bacterium]
NDGLLVLDELSQCDPREAGNIAYMLSNGSGKVRANRSGSARASLTWRLLFLSAGEISLSQHMQQAGQRPRAGQEIRLIDLPADAGKDLGLFDTIHGHSNGAAFSKLVVENCTQYHGRVGNDYLNELCKGLDNEPAKLKLAIKRLASNLLGANTDGQLSRGAERFAVVGVAGELATKWGFTGWDTGEAEAAAKLCFSAWVDSRGGTKNHENGAILSQVQSFFELHGESRFTPIDRIDDRTTYNRAGFRQEFEDIDGCTHTLYYCLSEAYNNEICRGFDPKLVSRILIEAGYLIPDNSGKSSRQTRLPGQGNVRCYHIRPTAST